jgi:hypothetical protein
MTETDEELIKHLRWLERKIWEYGQTLNRLVNKGDNVRRLLGLPDDDLDDPEGAR